jgi:ArsR family transcriptional regulator
MNNKFVCDCEVIHEDVVTLVKEEMIKENKLIDISSLFKVMGDKTRISILNALIKHELCVCDIAVLLNMTQSAISHQLRVLRNNRLIKPRREGKVVYYSILDSHVESLLRVALEHVSEVDKNE